MLLLYIFFDFITICDVDKYLIVLYSTSCRQGRLWNSTRGVLFCCHAYDEKGSADLLKNITLAAARR